jgi:formylglycine-generating enzyme
MFVRIDRREFLMGFDLRPVHVESFELAIHPVTNAEYQQFLDATGHEPPPQRFDDPRQPVVAVSWFDAMRYCDWIGARLPMEAEWECAARGGIEGALYPWGNDPPQSRPRYHERWRNGPEPVASGEPNAFGLYDLCENVHEWCSDWDVEGVRRASRGGSWRHHVKISRCAARSSLPPEQRYADYGFRVAR